MGLKHVLGSLLPLTQHTDYSSPGQLSVTHFLTLMSCNPLLEREVRIAQILIAPLAGFSKHVPGMYIYIFWPTEGWMWTWSPHLVVCGWSPQGNLQPSRVRLSWDPLPSKFSLDPITLLSNYRVWFPEQSWGSQHDAMWQVYQNCYIWCFWTSFSCPGLVQQHSWIDSFCILLQIKILNIFGVSGASGNLFQMILKQSPRFCTVLVASMMDRGAFWWNISSVFSPETPCHCCKQLGSLASPVAGWGSYFLLL